jgi:hypothetical protein
LVAICTQSIAAEVQLFIPRDEGVNFITRRIHFGSKVFRITPIGEVVYRFIQVVSAITVSQFIGGENHDFTIRRDAGIFNWAIVFENF